MMRHEPIYRGIGSGCNERITAKCLCRYDRGIFCNGYIGMRKCKYCCYVGKYIAKAAIFLYTIQKAA